ncbi:killer cell lectin-like receptor subfamily B member 1B allele B [Rhineura floridana]|uniref:killer cell lectin-like receptor subfamily B member 1B allele B n=1 Tax=Rhineura floridana TaxID=261503 RepID=UPI002AC87EDA|nr:killer cell lectin-like receptor subfamily B member 1B allele B [Rhineura floridana]
MPVELKPLEPSRAGLKIQPTSSLKMKFLMQSPQEVKETRKGPAFWSTTSPKLRRELPRLQSQPQWGIQAKVPAPPKFLGLVTWWQISALLLVAAALALFTFLLTLLAAYVKGANDMDAMVLRLERWENRLKEAVRQEAAGRTLSCKSCKGNWIQWADGCYLHTTIMMSWKECVMHCKLFKASLLTGNTEGEMEYLLLQTEAWFSINNKWLLPGRYWIGLIYNVTEGSWHWADGANLHLKL